MTAILPNAKLTSLRLNAVLAEDVMTASPVSIREELTVHEAVVFLTERRISAAPVINEALHVMLAGIWWRRAALLSVLDTGMLDH